MYPHRRIPSHLYIAMMPVLIHTRISQISCPLPYVVPIEAIAVALPPCLEPPIWIFLLFRRRLGRP